jgi:hypothetical protein
LLPGVSICIVLFRIDEHFCKHYRLKFIDLEFNFKVFALILLHFNVNKMNRGSYLIFKKKMFSSNHPVVLYRNMRILRRKLRCDTAYFKP